MTSNSSSRNFQRGPQGSISPKSERCVIRFDSAFGVALAESDAEDEQRERETRAVKHHGEDGEPGFHPLQVHASVHEKSAGTVDNARECTHAYASVTAACLYLILLESVSGNATAAHRSTPRAAVLSIGFVVQKVSVKLATRQSECPKGLWFLESSSRVEGTLRTVDRMLHMDRLRMKSPGASGETLLQERVG